MKRKIKNQRGVAAVEFALILIPLVLLVFGTIEFSTLLYDKAVITNASREGARAGIVFSTPGDVSDADIITVINNYCSDHMISLGGNSSIDTTITRNVVGSVRSLTVRVSYVYRFLILPSFISTLSDGLRLEAETIMRMENQGS
jgi:Flp pilus assembly protein TadG